MRLINQLSQELASCLKTETSSGKVARLRILEAGTFSTDEGLDRHTKRKVKRTMTLLYLQLKKELRNEKKNSNEPSPTTTR